MTCSICGEQLSHGLARVDEGRLYHVECFRGAVGGARPPDLRECPSCLTAGRRWAETLRSWRTCEACHGSGYLPGASPRKGLA